MGYEFIAIAWLGFMFFGCASLYVSFATPKAVKPSLSEEALPEAKVEVQPEQIYNPAWGGTCPRCERGWLDDVPVQLYSYDVQHQLPFSESHFMVCQDCADKILKEMARIESHNGFHPTYQYYPHGGEPVGEIEIFFDGKPLLSTNNNYVDRGAIKQVIKAERANHTETYIKYGKTKVFAGYDN